MNLSKFKKELARVFDDNLHTKQWHNIFDYVIMGFILVSIIETFISTFTISERLEKILLIIDWIVQIFFTIEVSLRIWAASEINPKYKGFWGRVRYCFSFYGIIDILATYPFWINYLIPMPVSALRTFRIARLFRIVRLLRIFRYMKSFRILTRAIRSKRAEMIISVQFLLIVTIILSFLLYFFEHQHNPEMIDNGWSSIVWAFSKYIGDPGKVADEPLVTTAGHIIAFMIGILGIAIFAVPAGLIGSGFTEAIEDDAKEEVIKTNREKILNSFERQLDRPTGFQVVPQYVKIGNLQAQEGLKMDDIIDVINNSDSLRMVNLSVTQTLEEHPVDDLVIEHIPINTQYGYCIDRGSRITIVNTSGLTDPSISNFSFYVALFGNFNYISRELGKIHPYKSYYMFDNEGDEENLPDFMRDYERLTGKENSWSITLLACSGSAQPAHPTQFHITAGGDKGDFTYNSQSLTVKDISTLDKICRGISGEMETKYGYLTDFQKYYSSSTNRIFARKARNTDSVNAIYLRIAFKVICRDSKRIEIAKTLADIFHNSVEPERKIKIAEQLEKKDIGYA